MLHKYFKYILYVSFQTCSLEVKQQISGGTSCMDSQKACYQKWEVSSNALLSEICVHICAWPRCDLDSKQEHSKSTSQQNKPICLMQPYHSPLIAAFQSSNGM